MPQGSSVEDTTDHGAGQQDRFEAAKRQRKDERDARLGFYKEKAF